MRAGGVSVPRLLPPILALGVVCAGVTAYMQFQLEPASRIELKRLVRELFRLNKAMTGTLGLDIVVMPRPGFSDVPFDTLQADYQSAVKRSGRYGRA